MAEAFLVGVGIGAALALVGLAVVVTANSLDLLKHNRELQAHNSRLCSLESRAGRSQQNG